MPRNQFSNAIDPTGWTKNKSISKAAAHAAAQMLFDAIGATGQISVQPIGSDDVSVLSKLSVGAASAYVKSYNAADFLAVASFHHSQNVVESVVGRELFTQLLGVSDVHRMVVFLDLAKPTVKEQMLVSDEQTLARHIGAWCGRFTSQSRPHDTCYENWHEFLEARFASNSTELEHHRDFLESIPVAPFVLSSNQAMLANFVMSDDGDLVRQHLPSFVCKPAMWELLCLSRELIHQNPDADQPLTVALAQGWATHSTLDRVDQKIIEKLISIFCSLTPPKGQSHKQARRDRYVDFHNMAAKSKNQLVRDAFISPHFESPLERPPESDVASLRQQIVQLVDGDVDAPRTAPKSVDRQQSAMAPDYRLASLCAACSGNCCSRGKKNFAYLEQHDLAAVGQENPDLCAENLADLYLQYIPEEHMRGGCLFQAAGGCTLPRDLRSHTCNHYECSWAKHLNEQSKVAIGTQVPTLFVAITINGVRHFTQSENT